MSDAFLIVNVDANAYRFYNAIVSVIDFKSNFEDIKNDDQIMMERYVINNANETVISNIIDHGTTTKYLNNGIQIEPQHIEDGPFAVTTRTYFRHFNHMSSLDTNVIPSIWSIRRIVKEGLTEVLDPDININATYMYRITWIRDGIGYASKYFVLTVPDVIPDLSDRNEEDIEFGIDDGGTELFGVDGNPTLCDLGYGHCTGDADKVDALLEEDSWIDRCVNDIYSFKIEEADEILDYNDLYGYKEYQCTEHLLNRMNFRYRGVIEEVKHSSYHYQIRSNLNTIKNIVSNSQSEIEEMAGMLI